MLLIFTSIFLALVIVIMWHVKYMAKFMCYCESSAQSIIFTN